jgi:hypothetical protein
MYLMYCTLEKQKIRSVGCFPAVQCAKSVGMRKANNLQLSNGFGRCVRDDLVERAHISRHCIPLGMLLLPLAGLALSLYS